jgi:hypothetical protein
MKSTCDSHGEQRSTLTSIYEDSATATDDGPGKQFTSVNRSQLAGGLSYEAVKLSLPSSEVCEGVLMRFAYTPRPVPGRLPPFFPSSTTRSTISQITKVISSPLSQYSTSPTEITDITISSSFGQVNHHTHASQLLLNNSSQPNLQTTKSL